ncbi:LmbU family transcriptional regulator [Streptomyces canus]|uniref:LmbU family transcriptional regulator n=1 Tax=Streptomyces canus TaxID=58343 RepID=UPI0030E4B826
MDHTTIPKTGLEFPRNMPFARWLDVGRHLAGAASSSAWCLGDWLNYGEVSYNGRYREAIEQSSLDYQTLRNYAWVTRKFERHRRRENLSFGHHAEVASLSEPEQNYWLQKAEDLAWSRNGLRRQIRASLNERADKPPVQKTERSTDPVTGAPSPEGLSPSIRICFTPRQLELCTLAADRVGTTVEEWAARVLDQTARSQVGMEP